MKFRYLITDTNNGEMFGTNEKSIALDYARCDEYFVGDAEDGLWMTPEGR